MSTEFCRSFVNLFLHERFLFMLSEQVRLVLKKICNKIGLYRCKNAKIILKTIENINFFIITILIQTYPNMSQIFRFYNNYHFIYLLRISLFRSQKTELITSVLPFRIYVLSILSTAILFKLMI